jgi:hypothetical protein
MRKVWARAEWRNRGLLVASARTALRAARAINDAVLIEDIRAGAALVRLTQSLEPALRAIFEHCNHFDHNSEWSGTALLNRYKATVAEIRFLVRGLA